MINKAQVTRTLVIKSPIHLWTILKNKEELYHSNPTLNIFMYAVDRYIGGCRCVNDNMSFTLMNIEYVSISKNISIIKTLKDTLQCSDIIFNQG